LGATYEFAIAIARLLNRPNTLANIHSIINGPIQGIIDVLEAMSSTKLPIWGNAYVITTHGMKMSKLEYLKIVMEDLTKILPMSAEASASCQSAFEYLKQVPGLGNFLSAQIVADLKNTEGHPLQKAKDWIRFVAPGPGSVRGLNWVYSGSSKGNITATNFVDHFRALELALVRKRVDIAVTCSQDLQNCLCEFDKYMRVKTGAGRSKRKYKGK
jgi:hypothetical protein